MKWTTVFSKRHGPLAAWIFVILGYRGCRAMDQANMDAVVSKLEQDTRELALEVERLYQERCSTTVLERCTRGNYHECQSELPTQQCLSGEDIVLKACGDGMTCSSLWDMQASTFRVPLFLLDDINEISVTREDVIESVCFSQGLDPYLNRKREEDKDFWANLGLRPPQAYFGSESGAFRIHPGRPYSTCGAYDPRVRPWYIAASSGPKNVVLVLDTSGSMDKLRLKYMKEAAKRVVETLTFSDRVAIVSFATRAEVFAREGKYVYQANKANKKILMDAIDSFEAIGATNFLDAFQKTFEILNDSIRQELTVTCGGGVQGNTAILFLTDGEVTEPDEWTIEQRQSETERVVSEGLAELEARTGRPPFLFTYSVSENSIVHEFPKKLACSATTHGVWSRINEPSEIVDSLSSYYEVFTLGLGSGNNADFTAWSEPYNFATGGVLGTTVAAPVYDRETSPPLFLGVVGIDIAISALDRALGVSPDDPQANEARNVSLETIVQASTAFCPQVDLQLCEFESIRRRGKAGDDALCTYNCTASDFVDVEAKTCAAVDDYPSDLLANRYYAGLQYEDRACCKVGNDVPSKECPPDASRGEGAVSSSSSGGNTTVIIAVVAVVVVAVIAGLVTFWFIRSRRRQEQNAPKADAREVPAGSDPTNRVADSLHDPSGHSASSRDAAYGQASLASGRSKSTRSSGRGQSTSNSTGKSSREPGVYSMSSGRATPTSQRDPPTRTASRRTQDWAPSAPHSQPQDIVIIPDDLEYKDLGRDLSSIMKIGGAGQ